MNSQKVQTLEAFDYSYIHEYYKKLFQKCDDKELVSLWKDEFFQIGDHYRVVSRLRQLIKKVDWTSDPLLQKVMSVGIQLITNLVPDCKKLVSLKELYFVAVNKDLLLIDNMLKQRDVATRCSLLKQIVRRRQWYRDIDLQKLICHHIRFTPPIPKFFRKLEQIHLLLNQIYLHNTLINTLSFERPSYTVKRYDIGSNMTPIIAVTQSWQKSIIAAQEFLLASSSIIPNKTRVLYNAENQYRMLEYLEKSCQAKNSKACSVYSSFDENRQVQALALVTKSRPSRWKLQVLITHPRNVIIMPLTRAVKPVRGSASSIIMTLAQDLNSSGIKGGELRLKSLKLAEGFYERLGFKRIPHSDGKWFIKTRELVANL